LVSFCILIVFFRTALPVVIGAIAFIR
jgi:hypothetical protein